MDGIVIRRIKSLEELEQLFDLVKNSPDSKLISFEYEIKRSAIVDGKVDMSKAFEHAKDVLVVEKDGRLVGFNNSTYGKRMNYCNSVDNFLSKEVRGLKVISMLVWAVIQEAQSRGLTRFKSRGNKKNIGAVTFQKFFFGEPCAEIGTDWFWFFSIEGINSLEELKKRCAFK